MAAVGRLCALTNLCLRGINKQILSRSLFELHSADSKRFYAKKPNVGGLGGTVSSKAKLGVQKSSKKKLEPVEDPELLVTRLCGGNYFIEGEDPVLKPDSEYPEWLWNMDTEYKTKSLEDMIPDTWEYWNKARKLDKKRRGLELKLKYKQHRFSSVPNFRAFPKEFKY